jgi:uncharacterized membrane protein (UPF0127 family)
MQRIGILAGVILCLVIGFIAYSALPSSDPPSGADVITFDGASVRVEIADTDAERAQGLSGHAPLASDEGMLFVFPEEGRYSFWMKDMLFPIDILWLDSAGTVVHIERNVAPESYPTSFTSDSLARYVLEVRAGFATEHEITVGSKSAGFPL